MHSQTHSHRPTDYPTHASAITSMGNDDVYLITSCSRQSG